MLLLLALACGDPAPPPPPETTSSPIAAALAGLQEGAPEATPPAGDPPSITQSVASREDAPSAAEGASGSASEAPAAAASPGSPECEAAKAEREGVVEEITEYRESTLVTLEQRYLDAQEANSRCQKDIAGCARTADQYQAVLDRVSTARSNWERGLEKVGEKEASLYQADQRISEVCGGGR